MEIILENPLLWGGVAFVLILILVIAVNVVIGKKRKQEVEELERMFPDGSMDSENVKISVEKVRRHSMEREKRKQAQKIIPRERPKKGEKVLPDEDQEIIIRDQPAAPSKTRRSSEKEETKSSSRSWRSRSKGAKGQAAPEMAADLESLDQLDGSDQEHSFAVRRTTRKAPKEAEKAHEKDASSSRRMYKRSLLKDRGGESGGDTGAIPKASLIDSKMVGGEDAGHEEQTLSRSKRSSGKSWFSK